MAMLKDQMLQMVEHKKFGKGTVIGFKNNFIIVRFPGYKEPKQFNKDTAFTDGYLTVVPIEHDNQPVENRAIDTTKVSDKTSISYIVFQGGHFEEEYSCGYLWAPYQDKRGTTPHHWERITELKPGDKVFHYSTGHIRAISVVTSSWVDADRPSVLSKGEIWERRGRRVDCDPYVLDKPLRIADYTADIIKYRAEQYSGFNKYGNANQGYLFVLEPELVKIFEDAIRQNAGEKQEHLIGTYSSWAIRSDTQAIKQCDKSFFDYHGSTIPRDIYWFFAAEKLALGDKKDIALQYKNKLYDAYLQREMLELGRIRIFWEQRLADEFDRFNVPSNYPSLIFNRAENNTYYVDFEENISIETDDPLPEEMPDEQITEGAKKTIVVNSYERDPKAKKLCKDYYMKKDGRVTCQICGFDFGKVYGPEYANKIHVHHIVPVSEIGEEYVVDPIKDLIPVCPNCHMILHAGKGISVEDLKKRLGR